MTTATMPPALEQYLRSLTGRELFRLRADSREALANAWPYRHTDMRASIVTRDNVRMLRTIRFLFGARADDA